VLQTNLASGGAVVIDKRFLFPDRCCSEWSRRAAPALRACRPLQILLRKSRFKEIDLPD